MTGYERVIAEINLDNIAANIQNIRKKTAKDTKIMGIVKANAYGHGAVNIAKVLLENGADYLGVAIVEEALELRDSGIDVPILLLGFTAELRIEEVVSNNIIQTVYSYETAKKISNIATNIGKTAKIHIKIDTGMGRIGFLPLEEDINEIEQISKLPNIEIDGIFTHFSKSDEVDKSFTLLQKSRFEFTVKSLEDRGITIPVKHASNSAGIVDFDNLFYTMVRPGIILYGLYPSSEVKKENLLIKPAMSIKTCISHIKHVSKGVLIGYGGKFITNRESIIATVPVGYADGFQRAMTNGGRVLVGGIFAPVVGKVCMDQFMIDVTDISNIKVGDEVVILGRQCENEITADEIADLLGTISYEVLCMVSGRVPRKYIKSELN